MKKCLTLTAVILFFSASAWSQGQAPAMPGSSAKPAIPATPGNGKMPPADAASGSGMVVVPPQTGTESIKTPPDVDPQITKPTEEIDRKNRQKSLELEKSPTTNPTPGKMRHQS